MKKYYFRKFIILSLLFFVLPITRNVNSKSVNKEAFGFFTLRSQSPVQQLRFSIQHHYPWIVGKHEKSFYVSHNWKNIWMYKENHYLIDAEIHELTFRGALGLCENFELSLEIPLRYTSGGILDNMIEEFHNIMGIGNANREDFEQNKFNFEFNLGGTEDCWRKTGAEQIGWGVGNGVFGLSYDLTDLFNNELSAVFTFNLKLLTTTRTKFFETQAIDIGMSASFLKSYKSFHFYLSPGAAYFKDKAIVGIEINQWHLSNLIALEYHKFNSKNSWIIQILSENGTAKSFSQFSENTYEVLIGYKYRINEKVLFEIAVLENAFYFNNSPDFGLHLALLKYICE